MAGEALSVVTLRSLAELEPLRAFWLSRLGHRDAHPDFFRFVVETNPAVLRPHVLVVYRGAAPVSLLLGRLERASIAAKIGYLTLPTPRLRLLNFLYGGRLGEAAADIDRLLIDHIFASLRGSGADAAMLHFVPVDGPLYHFARSLPAAWRRDHFPIRVAHHVMSIPVAPGALLAKLPAKEQSNHKRRRRRFEREFGDGVQIDCWEQETDIDRLCAAAEIVARKSYQRGLGVGFFDNAEMRERLAIEARHAALRGFVLSIKGGPCAFWIVSYRDGTIYNDFLAYDLEQSRYAPGMFLVVEALEQLCRTAPKDATLRLDFGMGDGEWKESWGDETWSEATIYIFGATFRAWASNIIRSLATLTARLLRALLARTRLLSWLKQRWRQHLQSGQA